MPPPPTVPPFCATSDWVGGTQPNASQDLLTRLALNRQPALNSEREEVLLTMVCGDSLGSFPVVLDVKEKLRLMRRFWVMLPHALCSDEKLAADITNEETCWNGQARGRYLPDVTGDGLVNQINNPEVEVDISRPDLPTRQHILALRSATSRLVGACNGQDVDFQDADEDGSSGSGAGYNEDRPAPGPGGGVLGGSRHGPDVRSPRRERPGKGSSSRQNQSGGRLHSGARPSLAPKSVPWLATGLLPLLLLLSLLGGW